ncbi:hypothetical protein CPB86DRAFT_872869 [Serendipita vermifera]|nr:hypothetical protein CPB86DRAFT_872869 [Serendipita vermifera]
MTTEISRQALPREVFLTMIVDSSTPAWEYLSTKFIAMMIPRILNSSNVKQPRISYILYSGVTSHASPIVKDIYFTRAQDAQNIFKSIMMNLQGPVARTTPGGGSASLEALVRAIEHLDLLEFLEPLTSQSPKHIFFVTAAPPDDSQRPIWNKSNKFDDFGWSHCEEWLKQKSIALTMIYSRLPPHPRYLSLHASLNPAQIEPIPPSGPLRISLSLPIWSIMRPGGHQSGQSGPTPAPAIATPSPNIVASPAAAANSPNATRKRKATDEPQLSPRRVKFPPAAVGGSGTASTPSSSSVPPRPTSVSGVRAVSDPKTETTPSHPANRNINQQPASAPLGERTNQTASQPQYPVQPISSNAPTAATSLPPVGRPPSTQPSSSQTMQQNPYTGNPQEQPNPIAALGGAQGKYDLMGLLPEHIAQIQKFASSPLEQKRENLMKLQRMQQDLDMAGTKFQAENRLAEAKNEFLKRDKIREWIKRLNSAGPVVQGTFTDNNNMTGISTTSSEVTNNIGSGITAPGAPTLAVNTQIPNALGNADRTASQATNIPPTQSIENPNQNAGIIPTAASTGAGPIGQPGTGPAATQLVWKGVLSVTNQEGNRVMPEILVSMFPLKSSTNHQVSLSTWPNQLYMQPIRHQTPSHELVTWLQENKPEGVYCVKVLQLDIWSGGIQHANNLQTQQMQQVQRFNTLRNAVINNKLVLRGTVNPSSGAPVTIILFPMPANAANADLQSQIALARYTTVPNLTSLPGKPTSPPAANNVPASSLIPATSNSIGQGMPSNLPAVVNPYGAHGNNAVSVNHHNPQGQATIGAGIGLTNANDPASILANNRKIVQILNTMGGTDLIKNLMESNALHQQDLRQNPRVMEQVRTLLNQHQNQLSRNSISALPNASNPVSTATGLGAPSGTGMTNTSMTHADLQASLAARAGVQPIGQSGAATVNVGGMYNAGGVNTLQQQRQLMAALTNRSMSTGGNPASSNPIIAANNVNNGANMFNAMGGFNAGIGGGMNINSGGVSNMALNNNMNSNLTQMNSLASNMGNTGNTNPLVQNALAGAMGGGMANNPLARQPGLNSADIARRANALASQFGISIQDAFRLLTNPRS